MKRILLALCAALTFGALNADMYVDNQTPYRVKLTYTYDKTIGDKNHVIESQILEPHSEGWSTGVGKDQLKDGWLTKTSYKVNADIGTRYSATQDWPVVYNKTGASDGWNRKITIYSHTDVNGNEVFDITNAVML